MVFFFLRVIGAVLIVIGLYSVLWGKYKEFKELEAEEIPEPIKDYTQTETSIIQDIEANHVGIQKNQLNNIHVPVAAAISVDSPKI